MTIAAKNQSLDEMANRCPACKHALKDAGIKFNSETYCSARCAESTPLANELRHILTSLEHKQRLSRALLPLFDKADFIKALKGDDE